MLMQAVVRVALGLSIPGAVLAASGRMDDLILGWMQLSQVLGS